MIDRRRGVARDRSLAIALSLAAHVLAFLALFWKFGASLAYPETQVMNVELAQPWRRPASVPPKPLRRHSAPSRPHLPPVLSQPLTQALPADVVPQAPPPESDARVRNALRGIVGCDRATLMQLTPAERQRCLDRLAKVPGAGGQLPLNLDKRGDYAGAKNREPFLARTPKNGCAPRVAESDVQAIGQGQQKQNWTASVGCAWSF